MKDQSVSRKVELDSASLFGESAYHVRSPDIHFGEFVGHAEG
jgi:hypothetical protein